MVAEGVQPTALVKPLSNAGNHAHCSFAASEIRYRKGLGHVGTKHCEPLLQK